MATTLNSASLGFGGKTVNEIVDVYHSIYSTDNELRYGIVAFKIELI